MSKIRALGVALAAAGIVLAGSGMAAAEAPQGAAIDAPSNGYLDGFGAGSSNLLNGLGKLIGTGSGGVKPLP
ncbi:hypothetical protein ACFQZZ_02640 [Nocardia sp. GCM10030253]|uniref:hypothetical protein n=1 Tax=Nocardia sp. GCM10030253 TaxID=3273404 RepID=UPI0036311409